MDQSQSISMPTTSCTNMNPWLYGTSLMNYMRPVCLCVCVCKWIDKLDSQLEFFFHFLLKISFQGITGLVGFDQQGKRSHFRLHLMTITRQGLQTVSFNKCETIIFFLLFFGCCSWQFPFLIQEKKRKRKIIFLLHKLSSLNDDDDYDYNVDFESTFRFKKKHSDFFFCLCSFN